LVLASFVLDDLTRLAPLAPLHQPHNLAAPITIKNVAPQIPQVACFDAAFHRKQSYLAQAFALPRRFADAGRFVLKDVDQDRISRRRHRELEPDRRSVPAKRGRELGWIEIGTV
jgi:Acetokinase family